MVRQEPHFISRLSNPVQLSSSVSNDSEDDSRTGCRNVSHCQQQQDYAHPDDHTQPTYKMTPGFKPFAGATLLERPIDKIWLLLLYTGPEFMLAYNSSYQVELKNKLATFYIGVNFFEAVSFPERAYFHVE